MGMGIDASSSAPENITNLMNSIGQIYHFNILLLLPPIIVLYMAHCQKTAHSDALLSTIVSMILALVFQQFTASSVGESVVSGFKLAMLTGDNLPALSSDVSRLLERGGAISMFSSFVTVFSAFSFAGTNECNRLVAHRDKRADKGVKSTFRTGGYHDCDDIYHLCLHGKWDLTVAAVR